MVRTPTELFERYHAAAYRYFLRLTGTQDIAQDLTQELFLRILRYFRTYKADHEGAWVFRIARNVLTDYRQHNRATHVPLSDAHGLHTEPTQIVAFGVAEALALLNEQDREVFLLREVSGLRYEEIAAVCDANAETVRARVCRARSRLRNLLGPRLSADENRRRGEEG